MKYAKIEGGKQLTDFIKPMTAALSDRPPFDDPRWIFEVKWDGYRAIAELAGKDTRLYSRNGLSFNKAYPKVYNELAQINHKAVIDGEIVVFRDGLPSFQAIQNYSSTQNLPIQYLVFDCLKLNGIDMTKLPLVNRKEILREFLPDSDVIRYCDHVEGEGIALYDQVRKINMEGIIAKQRDSKYHFDRRSKEWLKIKNLQVDDFIIVGWTDPKESRQYFGALLLAHEVNGQLIYAGEVGTGFTNESLKKLYAKIHPLETSKCPLDVPVKKQKDYHWIKPTYSAQVQYFEFTDDGHVRHPSFIGLRIDK